MKDVPAIFVEMFLEIRGLLLVILVLAIAQLVVIVVLATYVGRIGRYYESLIKAINRAQADDKEDWGNSDDFGSLGDPMG